MDSRGTGDSHCDGNLLMYYFATIEKITVLLQQISTARLSVPQGFSASSTETLRECYNGVGPDAWSSRFRKFVTWLLEPFEPDALIHDWEFTFAPRTYKAFTAANWRFLCNGIRFAVYTHKFKLRAVIVQSIKAVLLALICQLFGWSGFNKKAHRE